MSYKKFLSSWFLLYISAIAEMIISFGFIFFGFVGSPTKFVRVIGPLAGIILFVEALILFFYGNRMRIRK